MGYYAFPRGGSFFMSHENKASAIEALLKLDGVRNDSNSLEDILDGFGWRVDTNNAGDIVGLTYDNEKYYDQDGVLIAIAPWVRNGSYIAMEGEDGYIWCWFFDGATCEEYAATIVFPGTDVRVPT